jgi:gluconolactonase
MPVAGVPNLVPTDYEVYDTRFAGCRGDYWLELLYRGTGWAEGPVWVAPGRYLVWSDIPGDQLLRWDETTGIVGVFRQPSGNANGNTLDREGRMITCEHGNRRVTRTEHDGSISVVADRYGTARLNSPNDVIVASDGHIWFTDPTYGILGHYEGGKARGEVGRSNVYRVDPLTGECTLATDRLVQPNGLTFSLDEGTLYVSDSEDKVIRAFSVGSDRALDGGDIFASGWDFDGFRADDEGRLWTSAGPGVNCYDPDGTLLARLSVPEPVANVCFGGSRRNRLFITATTSLYSVRLGAAGLNPWR